ncbi:hypothetical protein JCM8547_003355 [Rhodosporidiobolus lusitaniae]
MPTAHNSSSLSPIPLSTLYDILDLIRTSYTSFSVSNALTGVPENRNLSPAVATFVAGVKSNVPTEAEWRRWMIRVPGVSWPQPKTYQHKLCEGLERLANEVEIGWVHDPAILRDAYRRFLDELKEVHRHTSTTPVLRSQG